MEIWASILCFLVLLPAILALRDPYKILNVKRSASMSEIRKTYKNLAREWHPDKNNDPAAEDKFVEINKAYELLSDPERRSLFDKQGITEDTPNFRQQPNYEHFKRFEPFESFFGSSSFKFRFNFDQGSVYHKQTISSKAYINNVIPNSSKKPYLIMFYTDWCLVCMQAEFIWKKIQDDLEPLGFEIATIHSDMEPALSKKIGVSSLPYVILILNGHAYHYKENQLSLVRVIDFVKNKFPYRTIEPVDDSNASDFLYGWLDNRVRVLLFSKRESVRLRYLLVAFQFRINVIFGYVQIGPPSTAMLVNRYRVTSDAETLLIFNENGEIPIATLSMNDIPIDTMKDLISANRYLMLPRLSSQDIFDDLCPPEKSRIHKRLCVVLVTRSIAAHEPYRSALRQYLMKNPPSSSRVRFAYIFADKQKDFVKALAPEESHVQELGIVVLWRRYHNTLQYQWLKDNWSLESDKVNVSEEALRSVVNSLLRSTDPMSADAVVQTLVDEHALNVFSKIILKMVTVTQYLKENVSRYEVLPAISVLLTIIFVIAGGYFMSYLIKLEEETVSEKLRSDGKASTAQSKMIQKDVSLTIHEMRGETYNGLVRLLKPGCRTIVLLVDGETKDKLTSIFYKIVYPYRRSKSLMFAFLLVEKNLQWYQRLLIQTLDEPRELNIIPKNCVGTVLSLNGHSKYFCMYHAKYRENYKYGSAVKKKSGSGDFMGFEDSSDSSESETSDVEHGIKIERQSLIQAKVIPEENLLDGLANWLERLFDGACQRYYIKFWPNMK